MARPPQATTTDVDVLDVSAPVLLVGAFSKSGGFTFQDEARAIDEALDGQLTALTDTGFRAGPGELAVVSTLGRIPAQRIAVVGLGQRDAMGTKELRRAAAAAARQLAEFQEIASVLHLAVQADSAARVCDGGVGPRHLSLYR